MSKLFSFLAGMICGALVGALLALLLAPDSGDNLRSDVVGRWEAATAEARQAMDAKRRELEAQFDQLKSS